ncbi:MAG: nucleoside phosphorylase [Bacteroidia bacterium]
MLKASELIQNADGSIYHLNLCPDDIVPRIIFVGDQARVDKVADHFDQVRTRVQKREFSTVTGSFQGNEYTVISTGIGTDNVDIVLNELDALFNIDWETKTVKADFTQLHILRFGTCGGLRADVPVGSMVLSNFAIGGDGLLGYYHIPGHESVQERVDAWQAKHVRNLPRLFGVGAGASFIQTARDHFPNIHHGGTFTAAGFYAPQGRNLGRAKLTVPNLPEKLASFDCCDLPIVNLEMETAGILGLGHALGHEMGSLSVILANRAQGTFAENPAEEEARLIETGLSLFHKTLQNA